MELLLKKKFHCHIVIDTILSAHLQVQVHQVTQAGP